MANIVELLGPLLTFSSPSSLPQHTAAEAITPDKPNPAEKELATPQQPPKQPPTKSRHRDSAKNKKQQPLNKIKKKTQAKKDTQKEENYKKKFFVNNGHGHGSTPP